MTNKRSGKNQYIVLPWPEQLWSKIDKRGPDECWPFQAYLDWWGYGIIAHQGKQKPAHREVLRLTKGEPPTPKHKACHTCDRPSCCNPKHLYWGTDSNNQQDSFGRGRNTNKGIANPHASLTEDDIRTIRAVYKREYRGKNNTYALARRYSVTPGTITKIIKRQLWPHVE